MQHSTEEATQEHCTWVKRKQQTVHLEAGGRIERGAEAVTVPALCEHHKQENLTAMYVRRAVPGFCVVVQLVHGGCLFVEAIPLERVGRPLCRLVPCVLDQWNAELWLHWCTLPLQILHHTPVPVNHPSHNLAQMMTMFTIPSSERSTAHMCIWPASHDWCTSPT